MRGDKLSDHLAYPPRVMAAERAAAYVGFGVTKFLEMVEAGEMPQPMKVSGDNPRWDRLDLDSAVDDWKDKRRDPDKQGQQRIEEFHRERQARIAREKG
jgi:predicted DNA-binding transcriptional regulator AlpA